MPPAHQNALLLESKHGAFVVRQKTVPTPGPGQILVRIEAAALNPLDWKIQAYGIDWVPLPAVLGTDAAGVVVALGEGVSNFAEGDRVIFESGPVPERATFQQYAVATAALACKIPQNISFEAAASVPLGLATAFLGLHGDKPLGAGLAPFWTSKDANKPLVVVGGASSVGQYVIQLAKLSGFSPIIATASPQNKDYLLSLGATRVLPRTLSPAEIEAEVRELTDAPLEVIYDTISLPATQKVAQALLAPGGSLTFVLPQLDPDVKVALEAKSAKVYHVFGSFLAKAPALGGELYTRLTGLLADESIKPNRVEVLPGGLGGIEAGLGKLQRGEVSAVKLVVKPHEEATAV